MNVAAASLSNAPSATLHPGFHLVQISLDTDLVLRPLESDVVGRQLGYAAELARRSPGAHVTILVSCRQRSNYRTTLKNLSIVSFGGRWRGVEDLYRLLGKLHAAQPISVLTSQSIDGLAWVGLGFARRHGIPMIGQIHFDLFSTHAWTSKSQSAWRAKIRQWLALRGLRYFSALRVGAGIAPQLAEIGVKVPVYILPVPVPLLDKALVGPPRAGSTAGRVLFVGRFAEQKNLFGWLRVAALVSARVSVARFEIVGEGPLRAALEAEAARLGIADVVHFSPHQPYEALAGIYEQSDVFLLTSHYEGFVRVLVIASAFGLPVVATNIPGNSYIVADGTTGFLHDVTAEDEMAESVVRLLQDSALRKQMGCAGQEHIRRNFDPTHLTARWAEMMLEVGQREITQ